MSVRKSWELLKATAQHWNADKSPQSGAALAYYAVLALPPVLVILLFGMSLFYDSKQATAQISEQLGNFMGPKSAEFMQQIMANPQIHGKGAMATAMAIGLVLFTSASFFFQLQSALNSAWGVEQRSDVGWMEYIANQAFPFLLLIAIGVLLVLSVFITTLISAAQESTVGVYPLTAFYWHAVEFIVSCVILTILFALTYKFLPNVRVHWPDVWIGGLVTAFLFTAGKFLLGLYLGHSTVASAYGVAGSIVLILVWVYYSTQIFLFGAQFTQIYASQHGRRIVPSRRAQWKAEGESAAEDQEEAKTAGKPDASGEVKPKAVPVTNHDSTAKGDDRKIPQREPVPGRKGALVGEMADRVHSWRERRGNEVT